MRINAWVAAAAVAAVSLAGIWAMMKVTSSGAPAREVHVTLIGASIGQDWQLSEWPVRTAASRYSAESLAVWEFDKSSAVDELLMRPRRPFRLTRTWVKSWFGPAPRKPDLVILKECSSYFPGNAAAQRAAFQAWEQKLSAAGVKVMLATVVPVTQTRAARDAGKQEALSGFNDWVRQYAATRKLPVLDLDGVLRVAGPGSFLKQEFTSGDGSHLNRAAYAVLDRTLSETLAQAGV